MATYSIYLSGVIEEELKRTAQRKGVTPIELMKQRIKNGSVQDQQNSLEARLEAILQILELLIPEVGYTAGANRAASANMQSAVQKGTETELNLKKSASFIRARLEKKAGEVSL